MEKQNKKETSKKGRPLKGKERKHNYVTVSFNDADFFVMQQKAKESGLKLSVIIAHLAIKGTVKARFTAEEKAFQTSLIKVSNNINSIAKTLHYFKSNYAQLDVDKEIIKLENLFKSIDDILK